MAADEWRLGRHRGSLCAVRGTRDHRRRIKLDTTDEGRAQQLIRKLNAEAAAQRLGTDLTIDQIMGLYIEDRIADNITNITRIKEVRRSLEPVWGAWKPDQIDKVACRRYIAAGRKRGLSDATIRQELAYLTAALNFAVDASILDRAPKITKPPPPRPRDRYLTHDEALALIAAAESFHVTLFIVLALATAGRPKHILELTWDRVDMRRRIIQLDNPEKDRTRKGRATVPINDMAHEHLTTAWAARDVGSECNHVIEYFGRPILSIKAGVKAAARRAALIGVSQYVIRHTSGVWMAQAGVPLEKIAEYMGHSSIETTRRHYAQFHPEFLKDASDALDLRPHRQLEKPTNGDLS